MPTRHSSLLLILPLLHCNALHHPDKVTSLLGASKSVEFDLFSGYLNGSSSAAYIPIFYVLAESIRVHASTAPLVVWFNGGPGGSSLYGFFLGNGPYRVTESGDALTYNEFSWNQYANVLYLESPLGVGFSQNSNRDVSTNDSNAAEINFNALRDFMIRVHPRYIDRDYYLSGQSYAGVYVPYLARRLLREIDSGEMENRHFKGFAIGNPTFNYETSQITEAMKYVDHGFGPASLQEKVISVWLKYQKGEKLIDDDMSDIDSFISFVSHFIDWSSPIPYNLVEHCYEQNLLSDEKYHRPSGGKAVACYGKHSLELYMNRIDVKAALHVASNMTKMWKVVNSKFRSQFSRDFDVLPVYNDIFNLLNGSTFRILLYNGDTDAVKPALHVLHSVSKVAAANHLEDEHDVPAWTFYGDFAGMHDGYRKGNVTMDVLTVRGAGHSVPTDLPAQAFQIINNFISAEDNAIIQYSKPIKKHSTRSIAVADFNVPLVGLLLVFGFVIVCLIFYCRRVICNRLKSQGFTEVAVNYHRKEEDSEDGLLHV